jgi:F420-dependent oxidoreductase-like protein
MTATASRHPWFGLHLPSYSHPDVPPERLFDRVVEQAKAAEAAGFELVTVMDHLYQIPGMGSTAEPMLEGWSVLAALARETSTVRLGTLVTGVTYRNPAMLAKQVTTLDVLSGGRAILGIGAAWNEEEHIGYGIDFPPVKERMDRLEEALTIAKLMFTEERPSFDGQHYRIHEALNSPRPIQAGGPPILVGGGGEQRTLRIAAKFADMSHWFALGLDALRHKDELLIRYCEEIDRDPAEIERTIGAPVIVMPTEAEARAFVETHVPPERRAHVTAGTPEQVVDVLGQYIEAGFTGFTFNNAIYRTPEQIATVGELLRMVRPVPAGPA